MLSNNSLLLKISNFDKFVGRGVVDNIWYKISIIDYDLPIVITFSPCEPKHLVYLQKDIVEKATDELYIWGFDFITKERLNIISFAPLVGGQWYKSKKFSDFLTELSQVISRFPSRIGYGGSMGGFGVSVYSNLLNLDRVLLLNPFSTLNRRLAPFETRFPKAVKRGSWEFDFFDGAVCNARGYVIYDPLFDLDARQAKRYKNLHHLKLPGVGHSIPLHLQKLGMLGWISRSFLHDGAIDKSRFYLEARNRREYIGYYNWLLSKKNVHLTSRRADVIADYKYRFLMRSVWGGLTRHQKKVLLRLASNKKIRQMVKTSKSEKEFLKSYSEFLALKSRYGIAVRILEYLLEQNYRFAQIKPRIAAYRKKIKNQKADAASSRQESEEVSL